MRLVVFGVVAVLLALRGFLAVTFLEAVFLVLGLRGAAFFGAGAGVVAVVSEVALMLMVGGNRMRKTVYIVFPFVPLPQIPTS